MKKLLTAAVALIAAASIFTGCNQQDSKINSIIKGNTYDGKISFEKLNTQIFSSKNN